MVVYPVRSKPDNWHENNVTIYCDGPQQVWKPRRVVSAEWLYREIDFLKFMWIWSYFIQMDETK